jgi:hypothetical protein
MPQTTPDDHPYSRADIDGIVSRIHETYATRADVDSRMKAHAAALLAQFAVIARDDLFRSVLSRLTAAYESALADRHPVNPVPATLFGLMLLERLCAVGGFLVREARFDLVRLLATQRVRASGSGPPFLLAHIQRSGERQDFLRVLDRHRPPHVWVLSRAGDAAARNRWLVPDILADHDRLITSLCEFDLLCALAATDEAGTRGAPVMFGNFAGWYSNRTDPIVVDLLDGENPARQNMFRGDDRQIAIALKFLAHEARDRWGEFDVPWDGYDDERITLFLGEHAQR